MISDPIEWLVAPARTAINTTVVVSYDPRGFIWGSVLWPVNPREAIDLNVVITGTASVTAAVTKTPTLSSTIVGASTVIAHLGLGGATHLTTSFAGTSTVAAQLKIIRNIQAAIAGTSLVNAIGQGQSLRTQPVGSSTVAAHLTLTSDLAAVIAGTSLVTITHLGVAGFEIPYRLGWGQGAQSIELNPANINGSSTVTASLFTLKSAVATIAGMSGLVASLTVHGPQNITANSNGSSTVTAEIFVNAVRGLACTINGTSSVRADMFAVVDDFDVRGLSYLYIAVNVGVGFDPTDTYGGGATQTFPDGHTRDDFHEYLYLFTNIGVGFDPTDTYPGATQTFPDGHTRDDFWEYLYLYLNVVAGLNQLGQLVIEPGFTSGPILPSSTPPRLEPQ